MLLGSIGILSAGDDCLKKDYGYIKKLKPVIVLKLGNLKLLRFTDENGDTRFNIINLDGTVLAKNMSSLKLRNDFPKIEKKIES